MLPMDYDLLSRVSQSPNLPYPRDAEADTIKRCIVKGWLVQSDHETGSSPRFTLQLTIQGREALLEAECQRQQAADQHAREDTQRLVEDRRFAAAVRRDWWKFGLGLLLGWILGGFTPKEVFTAIRGLFS